MIRTLSAAAVLHRVPRLLIEDDAEKENKRTLELQKIRRANISKTKKQPETIRSGIRQRRGAPHLHTVKSCKQVVEDDHVAVDGEKSQKTRDGNQEEDATRRLQT